MFVTYPLTLSNLEEDMENIFLWFQVNLLKGTPRKFQFMILENKSRYKYSLNFGSVTIKESDEADTAQKMKFSIKEFFSKCEQICKKLRIWSHLLKKSLMEDLE